MYDADPGALMLNAQDVERVAEFFDCDPNAAYEFARKIWLPDARQTARRIARSIFNGDLTSLAYLCDHLREGARTVGADRIVVYASDIEHAAQRKAWHDLIAQASALKASLQTLSTLLVDCVD